MSKKEYDFQFKIILIGDNNVGKTSVLKRYVHNTFSRSNTEHYEPNLYMKDIVCKGKKIRLLLSDTGGQERYRSLTQSYYRGANGCVLFYNTKDLESFNNIMYWFKDCQHYCADHTKMTLVGTHCHDNNRQVTSERGQGLANEFEIDFMEASAEKDINVSKIFSNLADRILEGMIDTYQSFHDSVTLHRERDVRLKKNKCAC